VIEVTGVVLTCADFISATGSFGGVNKQTSLTLNSVRVVHASRLTASDGTRSVDTTSGASHRVSSQ
jgi:hypothetical protein